MQRQFLVKIMPFTTAAHIDLNYSACHCYYMYVGCWPTNVGYS